MLRKTSPRSRLSTKFLRMMSEQPTHSIGDAYLPSTAFVVYRQNTGTSSLSNTGTLLKKYPTIYRPEGSRHARKVVTNGKKVLRSTVVFSNRLDFKV